MPEPMEDVSHQWSTYFSGNIFLATGKTEANIPTEAIPATSRGDSGELGPRQGKLSLSCVVH